MTEQIIIEDGQTVTISNSIIAPEGQPAVDIPGNNAQLIVTPTGDISAPDDGNTAIQSLGDQVEIINSGNIFGEFNGIDSDGNAFNLINHGTIASNSRAVQLDDGDGITLENTGSIIGTGNQRNGTVYLDGTVDNFTLDNQHLIDAGAGNTGDGLSTQVGAASEDSISEYINIYNSGSIIGRGQAEFAPGEGRLSANGSSGVRFFNGSGSPEAAVTGSLTNTGLISAEVNVGFLGGVVVEDGVGFDGYINNEGLITGPRNGLYLGNANHNLIINNTGSITSGSRAVNLDGNNILFNNNGSVLGTGNQRNGTIYIDGTGDNITIENTALIDAGEGNLGDGIATQVGSASEDTVNEYINIYNSGSIIGRGQAEFAPGEGRLSANGSSGVRFFNGSGSPEATVTGSLTNTGLISAEVNVGFLGGVVVEDGVGFDGYINNEGLITGPRNGLYLGNANHNLIINNAGSITSGSRAVNLDGDNILFNNTGSVLGTGNQRNGTVYIDGTGDNINVNNTGLIDAGVGNSGSGISVQVGSANGLGEGIDDLETSVNILNSGSIYGRGTENVGAGIRLFVGSGLTESTFSGNIINQAGDVIDSETEAGILIEEGIIFNGEIVNYGTISGGNGFAIAAAGANGQIIIENNGSLHGAVQLGEGDDIFVQNSSENVQVFAGGGNDTLVGGDGIDTLDGGEGIDTIDFSNASAGVIIDLDVNSAGAAGTPSQDGGILDAPPAAGGQVLEEVDDVENIIGSDFNDGLFGNNEVNHIFGGAGNDTIHSFGGADTLDGGEGIDLALFSAGSAVEVDLDENGNAISSFGDSLISIENINGSVAGNDTISGNDFSNVLNGQGGDDILNGEGGDDTLIGSAGNDTIIGGAGIDSIDGGEGIDTVDFSSASAGVIIDLDVNSAGAAGTPSQDGGILDAPPAAGGQVLEEVDDVENIIGSNFNDGLFGNNEINLLQGGAGNDTIHSFGGADTLDGGEGIDLALFSAGGAVEVDLDENGNAISSFGDVLISIENINGSVAGNDTLTGNNSSNVLNGQAGDDILNGEGGNDTLTGGAGVDTLTGGTGADTFNFGFDSGFDVITDFESIDTLDVSVFYSDFDQVLGATTQNGNDAFIDFGSGDSVTLENVAVGDLTADNFLFA